MTQNDLFAQVNNAVLDLQAAHLQSYDRPLNRLASLLRHSDLAATNDALTKNIDLDQFLEESERTQGGMVGSARLLWPDDPEQTLGLTLLLIWKFAEKPEFMAHFGHMFYYSGNKIMSGVNSVISQIIIPFVREYKDYVLSHGKVTPRLVMPQSNKIFLVHGHDDAAKNEVALFLRAIGLEPIILHLRPNGGRHLLTKFTEESEGAAFAVVLMTPDDEGGIAGASDRRPRARQNVVFELGFFIGRLGPAGVAALLKGDVEKPSDFDGIAYIPFEAGGRWKTDLARELHHAKVPFDTAKALGA